MQEEESPFSIADTDFLGHLPCDPSPSVDCSVELPCAGEPLITAEQAAGTENFCSMSCTVTLPQIMYFLK